jgi:glycerate 2-kinase
MRVVAAPDKFKGTLTAAEFAAAVAAAAASVGWHCDRVPLADGGDGTLDVLGGPNRRTLVTGPLGDPVEAAWRFERRRAVVEMARASGLVLAGGADGNDAMVATTTGTGELLVAALEAGAERIIVGLGGSATTDGGLGAIRAMEPLARFRRVHIDVACDVRIGFVEAARCFAPQKGASRAETDLLERRLQRLAQVYEEVHGLDVRGRIGAGAAGGLAGGLAAVGARLVPGFELVADEVELIEHIEGSDLVVTGEGHLDEQSFAGKVVGGVCDMAAELGVPVLAVVGGTGTGLGTQGRPEGLQVVSLSERFGPKRAMAEPAALVAAVVEEHLGRL